MRTQSSGGADAASWRRGPVSTESVTSHDETVGGAVKNWRDLPVPWKAALEQAVESFRAGSYGIGAAIADESGNVVSEGRNRVLEEVAPGTEICGSCIAHAEINAIGSLPKEADRGALTLYSTLEPCPMCLGAIAMSGIKQVKYAARDPYAGSTVLLGEAKLSESRKIRVQGPGSAYLENLSVGVAFLCFLRNNVTDQEHYLNPIFDTPAPPGVAAAMAVRADEGQSRLVYGSATEPGTDILLDMLVEAMPQSAMSSD